jgi:hypothetical protein
MTVEELDTLSGIVSQLRRVLVEFDEYVYRARLPDNCCGGACNEEHELIRCYDQLGNVIYKDTGEPTFTVPLELLETKSFDAVRID